MAKKRLTTGQAATYTGLGVGQVRRAVDSGVLPAVITPGGYRFISTEDLDAWVAQLEDRSKAQTESLLGLETRRGRQARAVRRAMGLPLGVD